jgi:hypothetical protein
MSDTKQGSKTFFSEALSRLLSSKLVKPGEESLEELYNFHRTLVEPDEEFRSELVAAGCC